MRHKDANLRLTKKSSTGFRKAVQNPEQSVMVFVYQKHCTYLRLDRALLMRHKDANMQLDKQCGAGFHKAAEYGPDVKVLFCREQ